MRGRSFLAAFLFGLAPCTAVLAQSYQIITDVNSSFADGGLEYAYNGFSGPAAGVVGVSEVVLVVGGAPPAEPAPEAEVEAAVRDALGDDPSAGPRQVADRVAASLGVPRRRAYEAALRVRGSAGGGGDTSGGA